MKKVLLLFIVSLTIFACKQRDQKSAGEKNLSVLEDSSNFTTIQWIDSSFHDMGTIKEGEQLEIPFRFKNTGDKPLIIVSAKPGCGCTGAEKPDEPIMPGKEGVIKAKFSSKGYHGIQTKMVYVQANVKNGTDQPLSFTVNVEQ